MSDELKYGAMALFSLALFAGFANHRAERAIVHDLRNSLKGGELRASVRPKGLFGLLLGNVDRVRVTGSDLTAEGMPFRIHRGPGLRANAAALELDLVNLTLRGTTVTRFTASYPGISLDAGRALFDQRIILRRSADGVASAKVGPDALARFVERKFPALKQVKIELAAGKITVRGTSTVLGSSQLVEATGRLNIRGGVYLDFVEPEVRLNGRPASPAFALSLATQVNPVVDLDRDLGLAQTFFAESVEIGEGTATVTGRAIVPGLAAGEKERKP